MARSDIPSDSFGESTETLAPVDERAAVVADLEDACARVMRLAWDCRHAYEEFSSLRDSFRASGSGDLDAILTAQAKFVALEKDLYFSKDEVEEKLARWNTGKGVRDRIHVAHTAEGLPLRVIREKRIPLWGI